MKRRKTYTIDELARTKRIASMRKAIKNIQNTIEENFVEICIKEFKNKMQNEAGIIITNDNVFWNNAFFTFEGYVEDIDLFISFIRYDLENDELQLVCDSDDEIKFKTEYGEERMYIETNNSKLEEELSTILDNIINLSSIWMMEIEDSLKDCRFLTRYAYQNNYLFDIYGNIIQKGD